MIKKAAIVLALFVAALLVVPGSGPATAQVATAAQAKGKVVYTLAVAYEDMAYNSFNPYPWIHKAEYGLQWTSNSCYTGQVYRWYAGRLDMAGLGNSSYWMSSIKNTSVGCNRLWLIARSGEVWTGCVRPGNGVNWFGSPWNDNIGRVDLSRDGNCPG